jgi:hypothetical protein
LISVIFRSEGGDLLSKAETDCSYPLPKLERDAKGVIAAAIAALDKKFLLEFVI